MGCITEPMGQQRNVKTKLGGDLVDAFLLGSQEIKQQCAHAATFKITGHSPVARTVPAAAAAMGKNDDPKRLP